jgi:alpha-1,2-mannosyltransferase
MGSAVRVRGLDAAASRLGTVLGLGVIPASVAVAFLALAARRSFGFDFRVFAQASHDVLAGRSPYVTPAAVAAAPPEAAHAFFVYPPPVAVAVAPLAVLPVHAALVLFTLFLGGCLAGALLLLGVRDWRCYAVTAASLPVLSSLRLGAITPLLVLALAVAWRWRDRWAVVGSAIGVAVVAKLFLWPLALWLLWTRRFKAAALALLGAGTLTIAAWALVGFQGLREYPALLHTLSSVEALQGFSLVAAAARLGLPDPELSAIVLALPVVCVLLVYARRDETRFTATIGVALLLTPILWLHYFALLLVPVAIRRRSFGPEWLLLLAFWLTPITEPTQQALWRIAFALTLTLAMVGARIAPRPTLSRLPGGKP